MKFTMNFLSLFFGVLMLVNAANAESPREQLKQMVERLQKNPSDMALREKIIRLAQEIKPAPAVPEEADRRMARGTAAMEGVKSVADYQGAAKEFEQATLSAPWYGDAYFNLGVAQDKAENYEAALRSLKFALLASPNDKEIKALIFKVEYRNEKVHSQKAEASQQAMRQREADARFLDSLNGGVWLCGSDRYGREVIEIENHRATYVHYAQSGNVYRHYSWMVTGRTSSIPQGKLCSPPDLIYCPADSTISEDGKLITRPFIKRIGEGNNINTTETCRRER